MIADEYIIENNGKKIYKTKQLIRDYHKLKVRLKRLKQELDDIGWHSVQNDVRVQTSVNTDQIPNEVAEREKLLSEANDLERFISKYDEAWSRLEDREKYVLEQFYQRKQGKEIALDNAFSRYKIGRTKTYSVLREGVIKMQSWIFF